MFACVVLLVVDIVPIVLLYVCMLRLLQYNSTKMLVKNEKKTYGKHPPVVGVPFSGAPFHDARGGTVEVACGEGIRAVGGVCGPILSTKIDAEGDAIVVVIVVLPHSSLLFCLYRYCSIL